MATSKFRRRRPQQIRAVAVAAVATLGLGAASAAPAAARDLQVDAVEARDAKTVDIRFNQKLSADLRSMVQGNASDASYLQQFVRVSGGETGSPDAGLTGAAPLSTQVPGSRSYAVESPQRDTLRLVLGASATLVDGRQYQLRLDAGSTPLSRLLFRGADGSAMAGTSTPAVTFGGTATAAATARLADVRPLSSRVVKVTFAQPILSGMPVGKYANPDAITLTRTGSATKLAPIYVEPVADSDRTQFELHFPSDLDVDGDYKLEIAARTLNLTTAGGRAPDGTTLSWSDVPGRTKPYAAPEIETVAVDDDRNELKIRFNHRVAMVKVPSAPLPSGTGVPAPAGSCSSARRPTRRSPRAR